LNFFLRSKLTWLETRLVANMNYGTSKPFASRTVTDLPQTGSSMEAIFQTP